MTQWKNPLLESLAVTKDRALRLDGNALSAWHQHSESCVTGDG